MGFLAALPIIGKIVGPILSSVFGIVDQMVPDKDLAERLKAQIQMAVMSMDHKEFMGALEAQKSIILAEATGASWLQRNWRPLLMLVCIAIILNNYVIVPWLMVFTTKVAILAMPDKLWTLMIIGVGGYVGGRTVEKTANTLAGVSIGEKVKKLFTKKEAE
jgi:hypothetical protein